VSQANDRVTNASTNHDSEAKCFKIRPPPSCSATLIARSIDN